MAPDGGLGDRRGLEAPGGDLPGDGAGDIRYAYKSQNGINMRFIIIKKSIGSYGVGLDACEICGPSGYFMRSNEVVCKLCDVVMNKGTIGFKGGCNPIPFAYVVHDKKIKIDPRTLDELDYVFK